MVPAPVVAVAAVRAAPSRCTAATLALLVGALAPLAACRRAAPTADASAARRDAATARPDGAAGADGAAAPTFGPPNPWGDGALPGSSATGPEADATRATMTALRASIGFWRIDRDARAFCPTLEDLARTPGAAFDPATMRTDAWGSALEIECQGTTVRLRSLGPDRARDTPDDIVTY